MIISINSIRSSSIRSGFSKVMPTPDQNNKFKQTLKIVFSGVGQLFLFVHWVYTYPYAPSSVRCTLMCPIFGRVENAYKPERLCRREPLSERFLAELRCTDKGTPSGIFYVLVSTVSLTVFRPIFTKHLLSMKWLKNFINFLEISNFFFEIFEKNFVFF